MSEERLGPKVMYYDPECWDIGGTVFDKPVGGARVPGVVIPLLPDDPKPGEVWEYDGQRARILSTPYVIMNSARITVELGLDDEDGITYSFNPELSSLRRPPKLKTYRLDTDMVGAAVRARGYHYFDAESKEAALAKLSKALEEIAG